VQSATEAGADGRRQTAESAVSWRGEGHKRACAPPSESTAKDDCSRLTRRETYVTQVRQLTASANNCYAQAKRLPIHASTKVIFTARETG
jgi:hypothetical protein